MHKLERVIYKFDGIYVFFDKKSPTEIRRGKVFIAYLCFPAFVSCKVCCNFKIVDHEGYAVACVGICKE